jgi:hypothetical protein
MEVSRPSAPLTTYPSRHWPVLFMSITTMAGTAGRITGTAAKGLIWAYRTIDWAEVGAIVLHGLQVLIVLTLLAGRYSRRAWDAVPALSERLGHWYAGLIAPTPAPTYKRAELEQLTCRQLMAITGTRRKLAKRHLVELALAA